MRSGDVLIGIPEDTSHLKLELTALKAPWPAMGGWEDAHLALTTG